MTKQDEFNSTIKNNDIKKLKLLILNFRDAAVYGQFDVFKTLLQDKRIPIYDLNASLCEASFYRHIEIIKLLLKDNRVNPCHQNNLAIRRAYKKNHTEVIKLLWNNKQIKNNLKNNDKEIYNQLKKQDIKNSVISF